MKVGIFGGTFDPVHLGHLRAAEEIRETFGLERVYFVPAFIPPHKRNQGVTEAKERLVMLKKALKGRKGFFVSDIEIKRGGISYTLDTLLYFEGLFNELYFILGEDAFLEMETWYRFEELFFHSNFIVMVRSKDNNKSEIFLPSFLSEFFKKKEDRIYEHQSGKELFFAEITNLSISSTMIRNLVKEGRSIKYLVPEPVEKYIIERGFYRT